jgi:hypothetical protein
MRKVLPVHAWLCAALVATLLVAAVPFHPDAPPSPRSAGASPAFFHTSANSNFSLAQPGPTGVLVPGSLLRVEYYLSLLNPPPQVFPVTIFFPPVQDTWATSGGTLAGGAPAWNYTFAGPSSDRSLVQNITSTASNASTFNQSGSVGFSSQLVAIMASVPFGGIHLAVTWRWLVADPSGAVLASPWRSSTSIEPAEMVSLLQAGPSTLVPGASYTVCLGGAIAGRLFSLHLEIPRPYNDFVQVNETVPAVGVTHVCWSAQVPSWVPPGPLLAHVWNYANVTLLLFILKLTLVASSPPGWLGWLEQPSNAASLILLGVLLTSVLVVLRSQASNSGLEGPAPASVEGKRPAAPRRGHGPTMPMRRDAHEMLIDKR